MVTYKVHLVSGAWDEVRAAQVEVLSGVLRFSAKHGRYTFSTVKSYNLLQVISWEKVHAA